MLVVVGCLMFTDISSLWPAARGGKFPAQDSSHPRAFAGVFHTPPYPKLSLMTWTSYMKHHSVL